MASIRNLNKGLVREPESAGAEIERKNSTDKDAGEAPVAPKAAGTATQKQTLLPIRSQTGGAMHRR